MAILKKQRVAQAIVVLLMLNGCSHERLVRYQLEAAEHSVILEATGYAVIDSQPGNSHEEKLLNAMEVSRLQAYRKLAEQLYGQRLKASMQLDTAQLQLDKLEAQVQGVVRGAEVIEELAQGNFHLTRVRLDTAILANLSTVEIKPVEAKRKWWF